MIPLIHDFRGERVLIFGGGPVGARKARLFTGSADVVVVSPTFAADSYGNATQIQAAPTPADIPTWLADVDPVLVVAATDDESLNATIEETARDHDLLVNRTDVAGSRESGSVIIPATIRDDPVIAAISTGGESPALSGVLRARLEDTLDNAGAMATLTGKLRRELKATDLPASERHAAMRAVVESDRVWKALDTEGANARKHATAVIEEATGTALAGDPT